ncbi:hypothetical protein MENTO_v1c00350 [Mesoplasma entomophilum]|uniref:ECF transporter S component n=1 Tax=Mesoplasma entomophilum TaxID=2149 RepID=A0A3S5XY74_9MOLU|nr:energy-coupled thiamine transporter ThiT [Mesoplasma entomophilum]ATQ35198.1 hypothetical protein CS528_00175 [Mesoplasma entomophilum]ATZ19144.1 hypothetical protein MENTO_v1c00350 [Mesoplasma entomophilum]
MKRYFYLKVKKINTKDIVVMGLMLSLYLILNLMTAYSFSQFYLSLNIKLISIFVLATYTDWLRTLIVAILGGIIGFFLPTNADAGIPLAYVFDYWIPLLLVAICSIFLPRNFRNKKEKVSKNKKLLMSKREKNKLWFEEKKDWFKWMGIWIIVISIYAFLGFWSKTFAGVLFYSAGAVEKNQNVWIFSMSVNSVNSVFDWAIYLATIPVVCYTIYPVAKNIY